MGLCAYRNGLGKPGEGVHFHVFGIAILDLLGALAAAWALSRAFSQPFWAWALGVLLTGVAAHRAFCVRTTVDRLLFG